jgi:hypothetical protein
MERRCAQFFSRLWQPQAFSQAQTAARQADAAMPLGPRPGSAAHLQQITNVCGVNGCARVQTQRVVKHQRGTFVPGRT